MVTPTPRFPVLLHGFTGSSAAWGDRLLDGLTGARLAPVFIDLPGHGRNAGRRHRSDFALEATLSSIAAAGRWPTDLVGYSMGGRLALHFAAAFPDRVRRLVLESASPGLATEAERSARRVADERIASELLLEGLEVFVRRWEAQPLFETQGSLGPEVLDRQRELRLRNDPGSLAAALSGLGTGALPGLWERLPGIATPTLLLVGALDAKFVAIAERMAEAMPNAQLVRVPGAGHAVHLERPEAWLAAVTDFLARD